MSIQAEIKDLQERVAALELLASGDAEDTRKAYSESVAAAQEIASIDEDYVEQEKTPKRRRA